MNQKKTLMIGALASVAALSLAGCSSSGDGGGAGGDDQLGGQLVIYTMNEQNMLDALIPAFEDESGVDVEVVTAGTGELYQRIRAEASNPQGDVMFGGLASLAIENSDLWEEYVSANDDDMDPIGKNIGGFVTPYQADGSNLLLNTDSGAQVSSYEDLLDPDLKGKIAFGDPTQSSSAFAQLTNILLVKGGYESDESWEFVEELVAQLDGKTIGSSSQVAQDTANGEFAVALSYEAQSANMVMSGAPVEIVYPEEGAVWLATGLQVIKDAPNAEQGKAFIDFMTSEAGQNILAEETNGRPLRTGVESPNLTPLDEINVVEEDIDWVTENREDIIAQYQSILSGSN